MDYHTGSLIRLSGRGLPEEIVDQVVVNLSTSKDMINTFKAIEEAHWNYLDNYRDNNRRKYPTYSIHQFTKILFTSKQCQEHIDSIDNNIRFYNKYKKSLPTAGVIFYNIGENAINFVVIRMKHAKIFSMPKGKEDPDDIKLSKTATREFREETGVDLEDFVTAETSCKTINKTLFYLVETDDTDVKFQGFNTNEIGTVKWVSTKEIIRNQDRYSKQTINSARYLTDYLQL
jgi:8-oxo-dGTP pyrophosphatase MutT (NUDIX family)